MLKLVCVFLVLHSAFAATKHVTIRTPAGMIIGNVSPDEQTHEFLGIRYALAPTGPLRWLPPQPLAHTPSLTNATVAPPSCPNAVWGASPYCATCSTRSNDPKIVNDEDCLFLSVVTPPAHSSTLAPVIVFIHGGAGTVGASTPYAQDTSAFAKRGVVMVAMNYRLGVLGWMASEELSKEQDGCSGNYAVLDVIAALQWVQQNIAFFGGDPKKVTIFGQSYGGSAMHYLMLSPLANSLFSSVIAESGDLDWTFQEQADVEKQVGARLIGGLCADATLACARNVSWDKVIDLPGISQVTPAVCRVANAKNAVFPAMPQELFAQGRVNKVLLVSGHNAQESSLTDYFSTKPHSHFVSLYNSSDSLQAAAEARLSQTYNTGGGRKDKSATSEQVHAAAVKALDSLYPANSASNSEDGYDRLVSLKTGSGEALASYAWARQWAKLGLPVFHYEFAARAENAGDMALFKAMHLLELTYVLNRTDIILTANEPRTLSANETLLTEKMGDYFSGIAANGEKGLAGWAQFASVGSSEDKFVTNVIGENGEVTTVVGWQKEAMEFFLDWEGVDY